MCGQTPTDIVFQIGYSKNCSAEWTPGRLTKKLVAPGERCGTRFKKCFGGGRFEGKIGARKNETRTGPHHCRRRRNSRATVKASSQKFLICLVLALGTLALYSPTAGYDFVNFDDDEYILNNPHVNSGFSLDNLAWSFQAGYSCNWHPLTWMSHMLDCQVYRLNPGGHHITSVIFHALNAALLFLLWERMTGARWRSAIVAALFAWHPMHVESVAWISERKDVLCAFFTLITLWFYVRCCAEPGRARKGWYIASLLSYALALMAKPMAVTLPCLLLLLDWWPLRRPNARKLIWEKAPFFAMAAACSVLAFIAQARGGAVQSLSTVSLGFRIYNAVLSCWRYIIKLVFPTKLAAIYPIIPGDTSIWKAVLAAFLLAEVTVRFVGARRTRPYLLMGWLWYLIGLAPVIGIVQVGAQTMADRYTYLPSVGIFVAVCWGISDLSERWRHRTTVLSVSAALVLLVFAVTTSIQLPYWRNGGTLFRHAIEVTQGNYAAEVNYGDYLLNNNDLRAARAHCNEALRLWLNDPDAHLLLGQIDYREGAYTSAMSEFNRAIHLSPDWPEAKVELQRVEMAIAARRKPAGTR